MSFGIPVRNGLGIGLIPSTAVSTLRIGGRPALILNFIGTTSLDSRITFTRGSNATLVDSTGKIVYAPANFILRSQEFDNASWTKTNVTVVANATTAPDGTTTADRIVPSTSSVTNHRVQISPSYPAATYSVSVYAKADGYNWLKIRAGAGYANFNVSSGVTGLIGGTTISSNISNAGNGWYRCNLIFSTVGGDVIYFYATTTNNAGLDGDAYAGDGISGIYAWGAQLEPVTYQITPGTYNVTTSAIYYGPRFDYDPVTLAAKGLLIEEQRINLFLNSKADGTSLSTQSVTVTAAAHTISFYGTGSITLTGAATATVTGTGAYPNRQTLTFTPLVGVLVCTVSGSVQYAQIEAGAFATSYIPTVASTVTRSADVATMTGTNFSSWFNATQGTFVSQFTPSNILGTSTVLDANNTTANESTRLQTVTANPFFVVTDGSVDQANIDAGTVAANTTYRMAGAYALNDFAASIGGAAAVVDTSGTLPTVTQLQIGNSAAGARLNGCIGSISYYNTRLSNTTLQVLTV